MPSLAVKTGDGKRGGIWEVRWTWMPYFLAADAHLVARVDQRMNDLFKNGTPPIPGVLDKAIVDEVMKAYPMEGLREALEALLKVNPEVNLVKMVENMEEECRT